jgi:hypothetical protein
MAHPNATSNDGHSPSSLEIANCGASASDSPTHPALTRFELFPKLPSEIRLAIWHLTVQPRVVEVRQAYDPRRVNIFLNQTPPALHVCVESRRAVERRYILSNQEGIPKHGSPPSARLPRPANPFYFNPTIDILYISKNSPKDIFEYSGFSSGWVGIIDLVRHLAVDETFLSKDLLRVSDWPGDQTLIPVKRRLCKITADAQCWCVTSGHLRVVEFADFKTNAREAQALKDDPLSWISLKVQQMDARKQTREELMRQWYPAHRIPHIVNERLLCCDSRTKPLFL